MPRFIVTNGSYFEPLSYEELVKPVAVAQEAQNSAEEAYATLSTEASALGQYISDNPGDAKAKALYDSYITKLNTLQDNLWKNGYNAQTRQDLASARAGYAKDITRLMSAVKTRQERSKEYWETKHKNPDMIMGTDPGLSGLDAYLDDENYGQNYYTYSGRQFMSEVAADAKTRANELLGNPQYSKNPQLAGYITRIAKEGFSSMEVANASNAVADAISSGNGESLGNLSIAEALLADVLMSHLNSTGAQGNVSPDEFNRLFEYGRAGLSSAIGKTTTTELSDKMWDYNRQKDLMNLRNSVKSGPSVVVNQAPKQDTGYTLNDISTYLEDRRAKKNNKLLKENIVDPVKQPIIYKSNDGTQGLITSALDAAAILDSFGRQSIIQKYGIPDPDHQLMDKKFTMPDGTEARLHVGLYEGTNQTVFQVKNNGKWVTDGQLTYQWKQDESAYKKAYRDWQNNNEGIDLGKLAVPQSKRDKMYSENGIPKEVPFEYVPSIINTLSKQGNVTPATIAGSTADMETTRKNYGAQIATSFGRGANSKGKVAETSNLAFYPVDGYKISDEGEGDIKKVMNNDSVINEIVVLPDDLAQNKVRVMIDGKTWAIDPAMLGNDVNSQIQKMRGAVMTMMSPIIDPSSAVMMDDKQIENWILLTQQLIGNYFPVVGTSQDGQTVAITPEDIVVDPELQGALRTAVTRFMDHVLAEARDNMMQNNMQVHGNTSTKASGYNDNIQE